ncbi:uncharacterized protein [Triticum aestivum]|uniref:uncharacterized protein n=1 Tax=Triticum aestivum TaxID=4565 RepID=UPI001D008D3A|nr:uncharacterized protein LOC123158245 [Triticum aestivum]
MGPLDPSAARPQVDRAAPRATAAPAAEPHHQRAPPLPPRRVPPPRGSVRAPMPAPHRRLRSSFIGKPAALSSRGPKSHEPPRAPPLPRSQKRQATVASGPTPRRPRADLASPGDVDALRARFRRESPALNDARCGDLCLTCDIYGDADELKYYDAVLETVEKAAHGTVDGVERCACRFTVRWTEGPRRGCWDNVGVEVVCCVQESPIQDPVLIEFLDDVKQVWRGPTDQGEATAASQQAAPTRTPAVSRWYSLVYSSSN